MDDAIELSSYLPVSFKTSSEQEYSAFLWNSFEVNYSRGQYQFAFLAYHMLTMSFVYFCIWQIKEAHPADFVNGLIGFGRDTEKTILRASSPFALSTIPERTVFNFLKLIGCDHSMIGRWKKLVDKRNDIAHANGNIVFRELLVIDEQIVERLGVVDEMQRCSKPVIEDLYRRFLIESYDPERREHLDADDQIREVLIRDNYMSHKDIEVCRRLNVCAIDDVEDLEEITVLHDALCDTYAD